MTNKNNEFSNYAYYQFVIRKKNTNFNLIWLFGIASRINVSIFVYLFTSSMRSTYVLLARDQTNKLIYNKS